MNHSPALHSRPWLRMPPAVACLIALGACGGGGDSTSSAPPAPTYAVSLSISGVSAAGLAVSDGTESILVSSGSISFPTRLPSGRAYAVSVERQPSGYTVFCEPTGSQVSGAIGSSGVTVSIDCRSSTAKVSTAAGSTTAGHTDGSQDQATFNGPFGVAVNSAGTVWVIDGYNNEIRLIDNTDFHIVTTLAGSTTAGFIDGTGTAARFNQPGAIVIDSRGDAFIADVSNNAIRKVTLAGVVSTIGGNGTPGYADGSVTSARFSAPVGLAIDSSDNVYVVEYNNHSIRKITPAGVVSTITSALHNPHGVAVDFSGNFYVTQSDPSKVVKVTPAGVVSTLVDGGGLLYPTGILSVAGNLYVADTDANQIVKIAADGSVTSLAGSSTAGHADGVAAQASFNHPYGLALSNTGTLYVTDVLNNTIRTIDTAPVAAP